MSRLPGLTLLLVSGLFIGCATAHAQDGLSAEAFLRSVYGRYKSGGKPIAPTDADAASIYAPALVKLFLADEKAVNGEVGVLEADPICACQDFDIRSVRISSHQSAPGRADATARFNNLGTATVVRFELVAVDGNWRIADIDEEGVGLLSKALKDEIAAIAAQ